MPIPSHQPLEPLVRPIYYCSECDRGSTAGPCTQHQAARSAANLGMRNPGKGGQQRQAAPRPVTTRPTVRQPLAFLRSSADSGKRGGIEAEP
jgi:hypothetical protein